MKVNSCDSIIKLLARKHDVTTTDAAATNKWSVDFIWMENEGQDLMSESTRIYLIH